MNIKPAVYEALTSRERVIGIIEAIQRNDEKEKLRIMETCPKATYIIRDPDFTGAIDFINSMSVAVECDLRGEALNIASYIVQGDSDLIGHHLQNLSDIYGAWITILEEMGVNEEAVSAYSPIRNEKVKAFLQIAPPAKHDTQTDFIELMREHVPYLKSRK